MRRTVPFKSRTGMGTVPIRKKEPPKRVDLESLPPAELAQGINNLIEALRKKGVTISNWDDPNIELFKVMMIRGKLCFLTEDIRGEDK